ncbi:MAG: YciI family protein [Rhodospirillaceae bacterium]|nr:YciI family protein [Rhodospirillaceae bacterium]
MACFAFICRDGGDKTQARRTHLVEHLNYIESIMDRVLIGGPNPPLRPGDTRQFEGSLMVYRTETMAEARALFENDPYFKNGVWDSFEVLNFNPVAGAAVGGKTWTIVDGQVRAAAPKPV